MRAVALLFLLCVAVGCGSGTQSLADSPEFDLPGLRLGSPGSGGDFGRAVAFVGDLVAVGASDQAEGRVHVYDAATGELVRTLSSPQRQRNGRFGAALAADARDLYIGAPGENRAYVVDPLTGTPRQTLEGPHADAEFGAAIGVSRDEVWVGAPATDAGRGLVVRFALSSGARVGTIPSPNSQLAGAFGASLAAQDGKFLIGAPGESRAYVFDAGAAVLLDTLASPDDGAGFGTSVAFAGGASLVGAPGENRAYLFDGETVRHAFEAPAAANRFGTAVAADGDHVLVATGDSGADVHLYHAVTGAFERTIEAAPSVAGEPGGVTLATQDGLALVGVFQLPDGSAGLAGTINCGTGALVQIFQSPAAALNGGFGGAVAFVGDLIAVSQPRGSGAGVYLFDQAGALVRTLSNPDAGEQVGALAVRGTDLVVGAPEDAMGGSVHIFDTTDGSVLLTIRNPDPDNFGGFGFSVAVSGNDVLVGAPFEGGQTSGAPGDAFLFNGTTGAVIHDLNGANALDLPGGSQFGFAVAAAGSKLFVGAPNEEFDGESETFGHVHQFDRTSGVQQQDYTSNGFFGTDRFGEAITATSTEVWIGAPEASYFDSLTKGFVQEGGLVFVFDCVQGTELQQIQSPNPIDLGRFGNALATNGSVVAVGALNETESLFTGFLAGTVAREGLVHLFDRVTRFRLLRLTSEDEEDGGLFGGAVAVDGVGRVLAGAPAETDQGQIAAGGAYLFRLEYARSIISPNVQAFGQFGFSVAPLDADRVVIGAPAEDGFGRAYIYDLRDGSTIALEDPQQRTGANLGDEVAVVGTEIFVAAPSLELILVFDFSGSFVREFQVNGMAASNFDYLEPFGNQLLVAANGLDIVELRDADGTVAQTFNAPATDTEFGRAISAIGGLVAIASRDAAGDGVVHICDPSDGSILRTITPPGGEPLASVFGFALAEFQGLLAASTPGSDVRLYAPATGNLVDSIPTPLEVVGVFGTSMAANADFLVVGSLAAGFDVGEISIFDVDLNLVDNIDSPNPRNNGLFGFALGVGPGYFVIGAPAEDVNPPAAGRAYVLFAPQGTPPPTFSAELSLASPNPAQGGGFGTSVAFSGTRLVVSAPDEANGNGRTYVFDGADGSLQRTITSPNPAVAGRFGFRLAANAAMLAIGAPGEAGGAFDSGRAYLYNPGTGQLLLSFLSSNPESEGAFGASVAVSSANVAVGAPGENAQAGRVYYFDCTVSTPLQVLELPSPVEGDLFGFAVATIGTTVYVGAPNLDQAYCFNGLTGSLIRTFDAVETGGLFGSALAMHGNNLLVGAPLQPPPSLLTGSVPVGAVFLVDTATGSLIRAFFSPNGEAGGLFGAAVASNGTEIAIGAPGENNGAGRVYVFDAATGDLLAVQESPNPEDNGGFGRSVAALAANVLVGAPDEDTTETDAGRAYLNVEETTGQ